MTIAIPKSPQTKMAIERPIADQGELLPVLDGSQNSRAKAKGPEDPRGLSLPASTARCRPAL
ncbi:hypothetical protein A9174_35825 (plasmid) [Mesorhizobium loti NZP2037]|uniref:hypothetical protein n=1 Tax=unclassified Mesorhizobium TaxID=325217 RepID=UPI0003A23F6C|nr:MULTISPECIES: hypothetical protein [Mesorhizobium]ANN62239.1 hypothetical protein A9174_35825 [Mesorhizobium loti NZP2037]